MRLFKFVNRNGLRRDERFVKSIILATIHRAIDVVVCCLPVTARGIDLRAVNGAGVDDRADCIVEIKVFGAAELRNRTAEQWRRQGAAGDHYRAGIGNGRHFLAYELDIGFR